VKKGLLALDIGRTDYRKADLLQREILKERKSGKIQDTIIIAEFDPVFTTGRTVHAENLLADSLFLKKNGVDVINTDRGGDITYHGPGQLVIWPIFDLAAHKKDINWFLGELEDVAIDLLGIFGLTGKKISSRRGVWVHDKKIAFLGIGVSKWVTYHGLSININTDLDYFKLIHPCGLKDIEVTSIRKQLNADQDMDIAKDEVSAIFKTRFCFEELNQNGSRQVSMLA